MEKQEYNFLGKSFEKEKVHNFIKFMAKLGLILLIATSVFILCHSTLPSPDDYNYSFVQGNPNNIKITSFALLKESSEYFYNNWTGRVLPHALVGIFRNINPIYFEVANTCIFIIFIISIIKVLNKKTTFLSILGVFGYLAFSMMFGEKIAWLSGAFNYLWPCACLAIFIRVFYNYFIDEKNTEYDLNILHKILLILFAFVTGFMHENIAFVGGSFLAVLCLVNIKKFLKFEKKKKVVVVLTVIMFGIGAILGIFAPGNFKRMDSGDRKLSTQFFNNFIVNKWPLLTAFLSVIVMYIVQNMDFVKKEKIHFLNFKNAKNHDNDLLNKELIFFILPTIIALVPMIIISYFPERAFLAYETMIMIIFAKNIQVIFEKMDRHFIIVAGLSIILSLFVFARFSPSTLADINYLIPYKNKVTKQYEMAAQNGERNVVVSAFDKEQWIHKEDYINISNFFPVLDWNWPTNQLICRYYGFDKITAVGDDEYLIEIEMDREGIYPYDLIDIDTSKNVGHIEYDNLIRYNIPKEKLGKFKIDFRKDNLSSKIKRIKIRYVGGELDENTYSVEDIVMK